MIEGRRLHGTAVEAGTGKPLAGTIYPLLQRVPPALGRGLPGDLHRRARPLRVLRPPRSGLRLHQCVRTRNHAECPRRPGPRTNRPQARPRSEYEGTSRTGPSVECEVRVRVRTNVGDGPAQKEDRSLTGRFFDRDGTPLIAVQIQYNNNGHPSRSPRIAWVSSDWGSTSRAVEHRLAHERR